MKNILRDILKYKWILGSLIIVVILFSFTKQINTLENFSADKCHLLLASECSRQPSLCKLHFRPATKNKKAGWKCGPKN